mmetsp:Transcript_8985/g.26697  ORF Transcript_8985/g.26697 Transcript_8985/m.26697 type:complete len:443 (+) Transcript_8985:326-1654(+)
MGGRSNKDASIDDSRKKKSGMKKLGSSLKNVFGGKKRRRRKKLAREEEDSQFIDDHSYVSYDLSEGGDSGVYSCQEVSPAMRIGNKTSLSKIKEADNEDESDVDVTPRNVNTGRNRNRSKSGRRSGGDESSGSSKGKSFRGFRQKKVADPLSVVVLLVDSSSLRFELLSLDFDLAGSTTMKRNSSNPPELTLTVQDVLDQITPEALTDEKLKTSASKTGGCMALIDRTGGLHFGTASLEKACAARPLRAVDRARAKMNKGKKGRLLSVPTHTGEPHRDVLVGFFANDNSITEVAKDVTKALDLARPIFADPNVVNLIESNGYDLTGWKGGTSAKKRDASDKKQPHRVMLQPQQKSPKKSRPWSKSPFVKITVALLSMMLATALAFVLVTGGLNVIPSISSDENITTFGQETVAKYGKMAYGYVGSLYFASKGEISSRLNQVE